jgi:hypothetical protein
MGSPALFNLEISGNSAVLGGGIYHVQSAYTLTHVTISGNYAGYRAGAVYNDFGGLEARNTIIWDNRSPLNPNIYNYQSHPVYAYSIIEGLHSVGEGLGSELGIDYSSIEIDPRFVTPGYTPQSARQVGDYHLQGSSPAIDRGWTNYTHQISIRQGVHLLSGADVAEPVLLPYDLQFGNREADNGVDMGAYEGNVIPITLTLIHVIYLPEEELLETYPHYGHHYVRSREDFKFGIKSKPGYTLEYLTVSCGIAARDSDGRVELFRHSYDSVTVMLHRVTEHLQVSFGNIHPVSSTVLETPFVAVWSHGIYIYLRTPASSPSTSANIYDISGRLRTHLPHLPPGTTTSLPMPPGIYIVTTTSPSRSRSHKVTVVR